MKRSLQTLKFLGLGLSLLPLLQPDARALNYSNDNLDAMLCFRKVGAPNPYDLEVNIGSISSLIALSPGTTTNISVTVYTTNQLVTAIGQNTFENVKFSVTAAEWDLGYTNYPYAVHTSFFTQARTDVGTQSASFARGISSKLGLADTQIDSIGDTASRYASGPVNTTTAVTIPPTSTQLVCETYLGPAGNLKGQGPVVVENQAPDPFDTAIVSDLFIDVPTTNPDPFNSNATTGNASYLGYFTFSPDGSLTFTRENASTLPPAVTLTVSSIGGTNTISFQTAPNATYTLYFTNSSGLTAPTHMWATSPTTLTGNGSVMSFTDVSPDAARFYRVGGH